MTSEVVVWTWPPGQKIPVPCGRLTPANDRLVFAYARSYLERHDAISLFEPELPLREGPIEPPATMTVASCLRDGGPDAWGRRVIAARLTGDPDRIDLAESTFMLESGSNRFGANDFQSSTRSYRPREETADLAQMLAAAETVDAGERLPETVAAALVHGTSIGGARPKLTLRDDGVEVIGKLSSSSDRYPVVKAEAAAMYLAAKAGVRTAETRLVRSFGRALLLVRRFDRGPGGSRRHAVSGLTLLGLEEMYGRYATYPDLVRRLDELGGPDPVGVFDRVAANIALGNFDDHARNHAAFWDGSTVALTPAYDICPQPRSGDTAAQAMAYGRDGQRGSSLFDLLSCAPEYGLSIRAARARVDHILQAIEDTWPEAADHARLTSGERDLLWRRLILNPAATRGIGATRPPPRGGSPAQVQQPRIQRGVSEGGRWTFHAHGEQEPPSR